ncbi:oligomeric golgi complex component, COG2-domain-containing protein [Astrocystis sublimbata]|nr:oligomeric golgi complex component, COG2-domain-containing protein [Astrocystis sublimbata]KAI0191119.1 oligomeric golgi complex component, COG2-domain-containing protein [Astrocystis sublimbata]
MAPPSANFGNPIPTRPATTISNAKNSTRKFELPSSQSTTSASASNASDSENDDTPLPFPTALPRTDFLTPSFSAAQYLSSLPSRHQTLSDLRTDLRERSTLISAELLSLINSNYSSFLGLGDSLRGGEDRVEDVRVGLLGFRRAVEEVKTRVRERGEEVRGLTDELGDVRALVETGRKMGELEERVRGLEGGLVVGSLAGGVSSSGRISSGGVGGRESDESEDYADDDDDDDEDEDDDEELPGASNSSAKKLTQLAGDYVAIDQLTDEIGRDVPFVRRMEERMMRCRNTLLLDLNAALKEARKAGEPGRGKLLRLMGVYVMLEAQGEAVSALKSG